MNEPECYFKKIHNLLEAGFNRKYKKYGLTSTQLDVLTYLSLHGGREHTLTDISAHFGVRHTSVIHVLKLLEKKGMICKSTVPGCRTRPIQLTKSGQQLADRILSEIEQTSPLLEEIMFAGLSRTDRIQLEQMLRQIYQNLESDAFQQL